MITKLVADFLQLMHMPMLYLSTSKIALCLLMMMTKTILPAFYILIWQRYNQKVSYSNYMSKRLFLSVQILP